MNLDWIKLVVFLGVFAAVTGGGLYIRHVIIQNHDLKLAVKDQKAAIKQIEETGKLREQSITVESIRDLDRQRRKSELEKRLQETPDNDVWRVLIDGLYGPS